MVVTFTLALLGLLPDHKASPPIDKIFAPLLGPFPRPAGTGISLVNIILTIFACSPSFPTVTFFVEIVFCLTI